MNYTKLIIGLLSITANIALAGNTCEHTNIKPQLYLDASKKALELQQQLNRSNPKVALISRVGSNLKKYGLYYTHIAFVVKNYPGKKGKWTVIHLLNQCEVPTSSIYTQGLMNFFMDDLFTFDYQITIPNETTQEKLYQTLISHRTETLHNRHYNMIAYPFSTKYQNSNQWVLEVIAASINPHATTHREAAQVYLRKTGYQPSIIKIDGFSKLGASIFNSHIKFDDHPLDEQRKNKISTVTVISVIDYLHKQHSLKSNTSYLAQK